MEPSQVPRRLLPWNQYQAHDGRLNAVLPVETVLAAGGMQEKLEVLLPGYLGKMTRAKLCLRRLLGKYSLDGLAYRAVHPAQSVRSVVVRKHARRWAARHFVPSHMLAARIYPLLWDEAEKFALELESRHREQFNELKRTVRLGGGADYKLLYFLTRLTRPLVVVETGVAAGWSSAAILAALESNGTGHLWSSELVYDRPWLAEDYSRFVGMVVDKRLHRRWTLLLEGDRSNLPRIASECGTIDMFHYDSDKSESGRAFALQLVKGQLSKEALIVFDDITDNMHFSNAARDAGTPWVVTGSQGTVGVIWPGLRKPRDG